LTGHSGRLSIAELSIENLFKYKNHNECKKIDSIAIPIELLFDDSLSLQFLRNLAIVVGGSIRLIGATARDVFGSSTVQGGRKGSSFESVIVEVLVVDSMSSALY
jgi:hypothetical protein